MKLDDIYRPLYELQFKIEPNLLLVRPMRLLESFEAASENFTGRSRQALVYFTLRI